MYDTIIRRDGSVVWRSGEEAGQQIYCTVCGHPVRALPRRQIANGMVEEYETMHERRSMTHGYHLIDRAYNDIGRCKL